MSYHEIIYNWVWLCKVVLYFSEIYCLIRVFCSLLIYLLKRTSLQIADILVSLPKFYLCQGFCMPNLGPRIWVKAFWRSSVVLIPSLGVSAVTLAVAFLNRLRGSKGFWEEMITNHSMWWSKENSIDFFDSHSLFQVSRAFFCKHFCLFIWPAIWWQIWPNTCHACSFPCQLGNFKAFPPVKHGLQVLDQWYLAGYQWSSPTNWWFGCHLVWKWMDHHIGNGWTQYGFLALDGSLKLMEL